MTAIWILVREIVIMITNFWTRNHPLGTRILRKNINTVYQKEMLRIEIDWGFDGDRRM